MLEQLTFPFLLIGIFFYKPKDAFLSSLKLGIYLYFIFLVGLSFLSRIEPNWTAPLIPGLLIIATKYWSEKINSWKILKWVAVISISCLFIIRVYWVWNFLPEKLSNQLRPEMHGWDTWANEVKQICGDEPVVFANSFQMAAKYWFYSGGKATCVSNCRYHKNQFDLMPMQKDWQGKSVWLAGGFDHTHGAIKMNKPGGGHLYLARIDSFFSYEDTRIEPDLPNEGVPGNDTVSLLVRIYSNEKTAREFRAPKTGFVGIGYTWRSRDGQYFSGIDTTNLSGRSTTEDFMVNINLVVPAISGKSSLFLYIVTDNYIFSENSGKIPVFVK